MYFPSVPIARRLPPVADVKAFAPGGFEEVRNGPAFLLQLADEPVHAQLVDHLERAVLPVIALAHGLIDGGNAVGDGGNQGGGIAERIGQHRPGIRASLGMRHQCLDVLFRGLEAGQFPPSALRMVFAGGEVPDFLDFLAAFGVQPVEPAFALASGIALFDHAAK